MDTRDDPPSQQSRDRTRSKRKRHVGQASLLVSVGAPDSARVSPAECRLFTSLGRDAVRFAGSTSESGIGVAFRGTFEMTPTRVWESRLTVWFILISSNRRANLFPTACSDSVSAAKIRALAPRARASSAFSWNQPIAS